MLALLVISCNALVTPLSFQGNKAKAGAATDNAAFTQTAAVTPPPATPTSTAQPTSTSAVTPTITPTPILSPTPGVLSCRLLWQSPRNGTRYDPKESFNMGWSVSNTGTVGWDPSNVNFVYVRGTRMHRDDHVALPASVAAGATVVLTAPLRAPKANGTYTTVWALRRGPEYFCAVALRINVP